MTNINCILNCKYQREGKCTLDNVVAMTVTSNNICHYYDSNTSHSKNSMIQ